MANYYLAIDIGASSGRHILSHLEDGKMVIEEIHRFPNGFVSKDGHKVWEAQTLFSEIKKGMRKCYELGKIPVSVGVDTWGVDFALLDQEGNCIGDTVAYRDGRTEGMDQAVYQLISETELYARTGIQKAIFNTIYQLMALKKEHPEQLEKAETFLMIPDYFHYLLSGKKVNEYTNATTSQLVDPLTNQWDYELIRRLGLPENIFLPLSMPGTVVGNLLPEIAKEVGFDCKVVLPATHDTGSAVMAVPSNAEDTLYISSGTWSLMGVELDHAICTPESKAHNLTNEGGYDHRYRYLKNIMGLWMIQSVKKEIGESYGFGEICDMAAKSTCKSLVDANDGRFLAPENMTEEVKKACSETGQEVPENLSDVAAVIYNSLAKCYGDTIREIENITGKHYDAIHIVGGGANAEYLNILTAQNTGRIVYAGPTEATAIGNLCAQMIATGELDDLKAARSCVFRSFEIHTYHAK